MQVESCAMEYFSFLRYPWFPLPVDSGTAGFDAGLRNDDEERAMNRPDLGKGRGWSFATGLGSCLP